MHVYVPKLTSTTRSSSAAGVSGSEFSQVVAPSKPGNDPSTGNSLRCRSIRPPRSAQRPERGAHLFGEELRLLPGREMPALADLVEVHGVRVRPLDPAPRRPPDLPGKRREADRDLDGHRRLTGGALVLGAFLPVRPRG